MASKPSVTKLGVVAGGRHSGAALKSFGEPARVSEPVANDTVAKDYFVERNGIRFAGTHLLIELWGASQLDDLDVAEQALREAAKVAGATLLHVHLHHFSPNGGFSGVAVLAESHISIHTWPERGYAAIDIFMCGGCDPYKSVPVLRHAFAPQSLQLSEQRRGVMM